jgi:hypothetical protein
MNGSTRLGPAGLMRLRVLVLAPEAPHAPYASQARWGIELRGAARQ